MKVLALQANGQILVAHDPMYRVIVYLHNLKCILIMTQVLLL